MVLRPDCFCESQHGQGRGRRKKPPPPRSSSMSWPAENGSAQKAKSQQQSQRFHPHPTQGLVRVIRLISSSSQTVSARNKFVICDSFSLRLLRRDLTQTWTVDCGLISARESTSTAGWPLLCATPCPTDGRISQAHCQWLFQESKISEIPGVILPMSFLNILSNERTVYKTSLSAVLLCSHQLP